MACVLGFMNISIYDFKAIISERKLKGSGSLINVNLFDCFLDRFVEYN